MSNDVIATDHPLTESQRQTLSALLDTLLPASEDGMPSAEELDLMGYLVATAEDFIPLLAEIVGSFDEAFADLSLAQRLPLVETFSTTRKELFDGLLLHVYGCYYTDDRVLEGIGMAAGPPYPRGNTIESGDLSLLDPVMEKSPTYRK